jgi:hypothetical protein
LKVFELEIGFLVEPSKKGNYGALGWDFHHQRNKALTFWVLVFGGPWDDTCQ